jgi:neutral ceramidase
MLLGTAALDITAPVGTPMAGSLRPRTSVGIDDPLLCKAMVLANDETRIALVTLDLIAWTRRRSDEPRATIAAQAGIPPEHILINCSHTHSGPYTDESIDLGGGLDEAYLARVSKAISDSVCQAAAQMKPVTVGTVKTSFGGVARNRRLLRPDGSAINAWLATAEEGDSLPLAGPNDEDLMAWVFFDGGLPVATLWNYTVHVNAHFGTSFSADYPGRVATALQEEFGAGFFSLFLPGACGDINNTVGFEPLHQRLSEAMRGVVRGATPGDCDALGAAWRELRLGVRDREPFQAEEVRDKWPDCLDVFANEDRLLKADPQAEVTTVVQAFRLGDGAIAATPGETFAQLGLDLKQRSPYAMTAVAELCNDIIGYIPTREAFRQGGYETFRSRWARVVPGSGEAIVDELVAMLDEL